MNLDRFKRAVSDAKNGRESVHGQYLSKWGQVWRNGAVVLEFEDDLMIPTDATSDEEKNAIDTLNVEEPEELLPSEAPDELYEPGEKSNEDDDEENSEDDQPDELVFDEDDEDEEESSDDTELKDIDLPKLGIKAESRKPRSFRRYRLVEKVSHMPIKYDIKNLYTLRIEETDGEDQVNGKFYPSLHLEVILEPRNAAGEETDLYDYEVTAHSGITSTDNDFVRNIAKVIKEGIELNCEFAQPDWKSLMDLAKQIAVRLDAAKRFLDPEPLDESLLQKINQSLNEGPNPTRSWRSYKPIKNDSSNSTSIKREIDGELEDGEDEEKESEENEEEDEEDLDFLEETTRYDVTPRDVLDIGGDEKLYEVLSEYYESDGFQSDSIEDIFDYIDVELDKPLVNQLSPSVRLDVDPILSDISSNLKSRLKSRSSQDESILKLIEKEIDDIDLTPKQTKWLDDVVKRTWKQTPNGIEVNGDVDCSNRNLKQLPVEFNKVSGFFNCEYNQLTSLKGAPKHVGRGFICINNQLTSLQGAPEHVGGNFNCEYNQLTSLKGAPNQVGGGFWCQNNQLTSLEGAPEHVGGGFICSNNQLTSLKGAPNQVGGGFHCDENQLTSLQGAPEHVRGYFDCDDNQLTSLKGAPEHVGGRFICRDNQLTSLRGAPEHVGGDIFGEIKGKDLADFYDEEGNHIRPKRNQIIGSMDESSDDIDLTPEQTKWLDKVVDGTWKQTPDGVEVNGDADCSDQNLKQLPVEFSRVTGNFYCSYNQLTSLKGAPEHVGVDLWCHSNQLTSLKGAPNHVGGDFWCYGNQLTSLQGAPEHVGGNFYCHNNRLTSLKGAPQHLGGGFYCSDNQLTSLQGAPEYVGGNFYCSYNQITSLQGAPKHVGGEIEGEINGKELSDCYDEEGNLIRPKRNRTIKSFDESSDDIDLTPTKAMQQACRAGLELVNSGLGGKGLQSDTKRWARKIAKGEKLTPEKVRKMNAWFSRHSKGTSSKTLKDKKSPAWVAWQLWGGHSGESWSSQKSNQLKSQ